MEQGKRYVYNSWHRSRKPVFCVGFDPEVNRPLIKNPDTGAIYPVKGVLGNGTNEWKEYVEPKTLEYYSYHPDTLSKAYLSLIKTDEALNKLCITYTEDGYIDAVTFERL